ncbi:sensor domain-containing protein [Mycobacterium haemophilum]|uniref:sensor domain-containing protein n=1 Tax=Mycobacterium haemophilum TaxID=29311 RepID=UPI0009E38D9E|nr:diguanylate cyclase [Mycobacterium haemophilum]
MPDFPDEGHCCTGHLVEQCYRQLLDHYPEIVCVHQDDRWVYMNPAGVTLLGGTSEAQFLGRPITEFVHSDSVPAMLARIGSLRHIGDTTNSAEATMLRLDGASLSVQSVSVLTVWEGKPAHQVILRDLSAHKAAEETQRYRQLIDHCPDLICVHQGGRWVYMNPAGVRSLGGTSEAQFLGRPITEFVHSDSIPAVLDRIASLRHIGDASSPAELVMLRLDATPLCVESVSVRTMWEGNPAYQVILRDLSAQKAADATLRFQAALVDHVSDAVIATTFDGIVTSWNPAAEVIYRRSAAEALGLPVREAVGAPLDPLAVVVNGGLLDTTHHRSDGAALAVRVSVTAMDKGFVLLCSDQTARRRAEQHFQTVVASLEEGVMIVGSDGRVGSVNPAAQRVLGIDDRDLVDKHFTCAATFPRCESDDQAIDCGQRELCTVIRLREPQTGHVFSFDRRADGQRRWLSANSRLLNPEDPHGSAMLISLTDITAQHMAREQLAHDATHDALTGLPNRAHIVGRIDEHLGSTGTDTLGAVLFIDLDNFKPINDSLGHHVGDQVLQGAAKRLRVALRSSDVVGRLGGDEFVALILGRITAIKLDEVAKRIQTALAEPMRIAEDAIALRASIGIVMVDDEDHRDGSQILCDADIAMYQAKASGGGTSCYFTEAFRHKTA